MKLRGKFFIPLFGAILILGGLGNLIIDWQVTRLKKDFIRRMAENKMNEICQVISGNALDALEKAALLARTPEIIRAFEMTRLGNTDEEKAVRAGQSREALRRALIPALESFSRITGSGLSLHFRLPDGSSLLRLGQPQTDERSEDLPEDRNIGAIRGVVPGRNGFVIRGIAPVRSSAGAYLGSVGVLSDFAPVLASVTDSGQYRLMLYADARYMPALRDETRYPVRTGRYVLISGDNRAPAAGHAHVSLTDAAKEGTDIVYREAEALVGFPVKDDQGKPVGVIVLETDISYEQGLIRGVNWVLKGILMAMILAIGLLSSMAMSKLVLAPVNRLTGFLKQITRGDLTETLEIRRKDEMGLLAESLNIMVSKMRQLFGEFVGSIDTLNASAATILESVNHQGSVASEQSASVSEITSTMAELSASFNQIADHSGSVAELADSALKNTKAGAESVENIMAKMKEISSENHENIREMVDLGKKSKVIAKVMDVINTISDQTKLIAFNAALEATSAGEAGKRFGVVASEIRRLADSVMESTGEIERRITQIQEAVNHMIISSESGARGIQEGLDYSTRTAAKLVEVVSTSQSTADAARQISLSTRQQQTASEQVVTALREIDEGARQNTEAIDHISSVSRELTGLAAHLQSLVEPFKLTRTDSVRPER